MCSFAQDDVPSTISVDVADPEAAISTELAEQLSRDAIVQIGGVGGANQDVRVAVAVYVRHTGQRGSEPPLSLGLRRLDHNRRLELGCACDGPHAERAEEHG